METLSFLNHYSSQWVQWAWVMLVQSSILIVILLGLELWWRKRVRAVFRYGLWMLVLVKLVLPVGLALPCSPAYWVGLLLPQTEIEASPESVPEPVDENPVAIETSQRPNTEPTSYAQTTQAVRESDPVATPGTPAMSPTRPASETLTKPSPEVVTVAWPLVASLIWLVMVLIMLGLLIQRAFLVRSLVEQSEQVDRALHEQLNDCALTLGVRQSVDMRISPNAASPSVCGLFRPVILIPDHLIKHLNPNQMRAILMHELAHVKRGDLWVNFVQALLQILYFFHPLLWVANMMIRRIREQAVDEMVLVAMKEEADAYPETLLNVSKLVWKRPMLSLRLIGVVESKSELLARIRHMLGKPFPTSAKIGLTGLVIVLVFATVLLPMAQAELRPEIPVGRELSKISGVSLVRLEAKKKDSFHTGSSTGQNHSQCHFGSATLRNMLCSVSQDYPVFFETKLPKGVFQMEAEVDGDRRLLLERVCTVFSQAFDLDVSVKAYEQKVWVLTCPNPDRLTLSRSDRDRSCGFYKQEQVSNDKDLYREKFIASMDEVAAFVARHVLTSHDYELTLINETNLEGLFQGTLDWSSSNRNRIRKSLEAMGLVITKATRTVESVVVFPRDPDKVYALEDDRLKTPTSELVIATHAYHPTGQTIAFTLTGKQISQVEAQVEFEEFPSMFIVVDGQAYKSNISSNPYSGGTTSFSSNSIRDRDKRQLTPGRHTVSILFRDYDITYQDQQIHVPELHSNTVEFEVVDRIPEGYFKTIAPAHAQQVLDDCHIQMRYLIIPTRDPDYDYSEHITLAGYTPPFNIAAQVFVESEQGKKVFIKDLAIASTAGEVLHNNTFRHGLHQDFRENESLLSEQELLHEKWRIVLEPSQSVAQANPLIKRYYGQIYTGPYREIQMNLDSYRLDEAGFIRKSHQPLSNYQNDIYKYLDLDNYRGLRDSKGADLAYQRDRNLFTLAIDQGVSAVKLERSLSLTGLTRQMNSAVQRLSQDKGNVETLVIHNDQRDLYAVRTSEGHYCLLAINGIEHNGSMGAGSAQSLEFWQYETDEDEVPIAQPVESVELPSNPEFTATLPNGISVELLGVSEHPSTGKPWWRPDGTLLDEAPYQRMDDREAYNDLPLYEVVLRLSDPEETLCKIKSTDTVPGCFGFYPISRETEGVFDGAEGCFYAFIPIQGEHGQVDLSLACGTESGWETCATVKSPVLQSGMNTGRANIDVSLGLNQQVIAHITHQYVDKEIRVIAKGHNGHLYLPISTKGKELGWANTITAEFDLSVEDTAFVELQTQDFQSVTFKNIFLFAGKKTDIEIDLINQAMN